MTIKKNITNFAKPEIIFGEKSFQKLFELLEKENLKNPLLVCGKHFQKTSFFNEFKSRVPNFELFDSIEPNPSVKTVNKAASLLNKKNCDSVIGIGGGSVLDASKIIALMKGVNSCLPFYESFDSVKEKIPFFALSTTSGTGAEYTRYSVLTLDNGNKKTIKSEMIYSKYAIVDPVLTYSMPSKVTATTGLDAFCQAVEAYWSTTSTPETDAFAKESIILSFNNLEKSVNSPSSVSRNNMALASITAARAFDITGTTACHSISYAFTKLYKLEHGFAVALTLPWFLEFYSKTNPETEKKCLEICSFIGAKNIIGAREKIVKLMKSINSPTSLREIGAKKDDFEKIIELSMDQKSNNPRQHSIEDIRNLLEEIF